ncbi:hypothetical protein [Enterovibrio norvegicus]|uniref:hypothetical protein n=1 Tax=Enterovibrio norvegicus TaxID=188144 RepID=UPI00352CD583
MAKNRMIFSRAAVLLSLIALAMVIDRTLLTAPTVPFENWKLDLHNPECSIMLPDGQVLDKETALAKGEGVLMPSGTLLTGQCLETSPRSEA